MICGDRSSLAEKAHELECIGKHLAKDRKHKQEEKEAENCVWTSARVTLGHVQRNEGIGLRNENSRLAGRPLDHMATPNHWRKNRQNTEGNK
jgi:hypothetical protein